MNRRHLGALALSLAILGASAGDLHAFGRGLLKRRAKREAKRRAKREAQKKLQEATGVDVGGLMEGDASAVAKGMVKDQAMQAVAQSAAGPYAKYIGMEPGAIKDALKADIMKEKGINRFSPPAARRSVDNLVDQRFGEVQKALAAVRSVAAMKGKSLGGLDKFSGTATGSTGMHAAIEMDRAVAKQNLEAAGYDSSVVDPLYDNASATADLAEEARARADAGAAPLLGSPAAAAAREVLQTRESRAEAMERLKKEIYRKHRINAATPRFKTMRADREIEQRLNELFR